MFLSSETNFMQIGQDFEILLEKHFDAIFDLFEGPCTKNLIFSPNEELLG